MCICFVLHLPVLALLVLTTLLVSDLDGHSWSSTLLLFEFYVPYITANSGL